MSAAVFLVALLGGFVGAIVARLVWPLLRPDPADDLERRAALRQRLRRPPLPGEIRCARPGCDGYIWSPHAPLVTALAVAGWRRVEGGWECSKHEAEAAAPDPASHPS